MLYAGVTRQQEATRAGQTKTTVLWALIVPLRITRPTNPHLGPGADHQALNRLLRQRDLATLRTTLLVCVPMRLIGWM